MEIENRVKVLRAEKRMTQGELAEVVGVTRQTIVALEKGRYSPSLLLALQIAKQFELPVEDVFFLTEEE
ncbi:helix-turn-helix transcriptional regulator [Alkalihalobacillus clausii]|jgi:putative transcriptional regulator|uniref:helix-turn-helix transcriptional regulator n=1 Tax=Shouchella clausii TaxID=79880 RepID=UPI000BA70A16|nr:helix-turn-helix transcriptional regulator [Shouchella clausii]MCM3548702.1 helix-turn-helix transcriptional regulator [Shouchella clausii]PAF13501.1 transcriptional regulator [Shouchella clausii]